MTTRDQCRDRRGPRTELALPAARGGEGEGSQPVTPTRKSKWREGRAEKEQRPQGPGTMRLTDEGAPAESNPAESQVSGPETGRWIRHRGDPRWSQ